MKSNWKQMSKDQLIEELSSGVEDGARHRSGHVESALHDLQLQKVELELRNMELRGSRRLLEESRARYAELYDFAPTALCTLDSEARIVEANLALAALFGAEPGSLDKRVLFSAVVVEDRPLLRQHLRRCMTERARTTVELRLRLREMGVTYFQAVSAPLADDHGDVIGCKTVLTDISALKRSEERLRLLAGASASLSSSFDVMHTLSLVTKSLVPAAADLCFADVFDTGEGTRRIGIAVADPARRVAAEALGRPPIPALRLTRPQLVSRGGSDLLGQMIGDIPECSAMLADLAVTSIVVAPMMTREQQLGTLALVMCGPNRSFTDDDAVFCADLATRAAMAIDNARLYQGAQRAIQTRQEVLSIVSHDLKTPVTGILLTADALISSRPTHERRKGRRSIDRIKRTARAMEHIIDDLLDMGGLDTGHLSLDQSTQCIRGLIDEAIEQLAPLAHEKQLRLSAVHEGDARWAKCDPNRVMQVLINLIGNAIKFTPEGGEVVVSAGAFEGKLKVTIRDTGPGISSAVLRNLFQRYWQAKETATRGRGLGLFIAKGIVEAQGGAIWVESKPAEGTAFHFTLPQAPDPVRADLALPGATVPAARA